MSGAYYQRGRMLIAWSTFASEVKQTREARYLSQRGLAKKLGIYYSIVDRAERGAPVKVAGFLALCAWMDADPLSYRVKAVAAPVMHRAVEQVSA